MRTAHKKIHDQFLLPMWQQQPAYDRRRSFSLVRSLLPICPCFFFNLLPTGEEEVKIMNKCLWRRLTSGLGLWHSTKKSFDLWSIDHWEETEEDEEYSIQEHNGLFFSFVNSIKIPTVSWSIYLHPRSVVNSDTFCFVGEFQHFVYAKIKFNTCT